VLIALLTARERCNVVHELYVENEIGQECLFVAMTYTVGPLAYKPVMRI